MPLTARKLAALNPEAVLSLVDIKASQAKRALTGRLIALRSNGQRVDSLVSLSPSPLGPLEEAQSKPSCQGWRSFGSRAHAHAISETSTR